MCLSVLNLHRGCGDEDAEEDATNFLHKWLSLSKTRKTALRGYFYNDLGERLTKPQQTAEPTSPHICCSSIFRSSIPHREILCFHLYPSGVLLSNVQPSLRPNVEPKVLTGRNFVVKQSGQNHKWSYLQLWKTWGGVKYLPFAVPMFQSNQKALQSPREPLIWTIAKAGRYSTWSNLKILLGILDGKSFYLNQRGDI